MTRKRADVVLVERGFFASRARAQEAIAAGLVTVNGAVIRKASDAVPEEAVITAEQPHPYVSRGGVKLAAALEALGIAKHLPHVYGYDSVARPKPAPDMVHAFAAATGVAAQAIVVIGDNTHDLKMARSAGAGAAIGVLSGTGTAAELAPLADCLLDSIADLPAWLAARRSG